MNGLLAVFLLVFGLLLSVLGAAFTNVWLCLYPVFCLSFSLSPKSLNYFWVKFKISKLHSANGMCVCVEGEIEGGAWCIARLK